MEENMFRKIKSIVIRYRKWMILFVCLILFLFIVEDVFEKEIISYDEWAYRILVQNLRSDYLTSIMIVITNFASGWVLGTIALLLFVFLKNKRKGLCATINLLLITLVNLILKMIIQRPRPSGFNIIIESGYSFPSGHSMVSTAFYGFLIYLTYKNVKNKIVRNVVCVLLFLLILLIGISRVYLGVHYASDVIGGFLISVSYLMVFVTIVPRFLKVIDNESNFNVKE